MMANTNNVEAVRDHSACPNTLCLSERRIIPFIRDGT